MKFQFNHGLFGKRMLPNDLRKNKILALLYSLLYSLQVLYDEFLDFRTKLIDETNYNSQTMILEYLLNENFDTALRRITIVNSTVFAGFVSAYLQIENNEKIEAYLQSEGFTLTEAYLESEISAVDFKVMIPVEIVSNSPVIKRFVNKYKLGGKKFQIIIF